MAQDRRLITTLAQSMLKQALFENDRAAPETIWRSQEPEVRGHWRERAFAVIADLFDGGYKITEG